MLTNIHSPPTVTAILNQHDTGRVPTLDASCSFTFRAAFVARCRELICHG